MGKIKDTTFEDIIRQFPDWYRINKGEWSEHSILIHYGNDTNDYIDIGLYREPDSEGEIKGTYTLQGFDGDDVVICHTVEGLDALRYQMEKEGLI